MDPTEIATLLHSAQSGISFVSDVKIGMEQDSENAGDSKKRLFEVSTQLVARFIDRVSSEAKLDILSPKMMFLPVAGQNLVNFNLRRVTNHYFLCSLSQLHVSTSL